MLLILSGLSFFNPLTAERSRNIILLSTPDAGMFSVFFEVLASIKLYEKKFFDYVEIDFADTGLYYSPEAGFNWWSYYFEPIKLGHPTVEPLPVFARVQGIHPFIIEVSMLRRNVAYYIEKYIRIKPFIRREVAQFCKRNFDGKFVIGIHYRGTDKNIAEAPRVPYKDVCVKVNELIEKKENANYILFIATDEWDFIHYMSELYPDHVCFIEEAVRSFNNQPIHLNSNQDPFLSGKHALMDCLLLSKTNHLLRTSSNLSLASTYFNPTLPVYELSRRNKP
jgi:hypothetical protein